MNAAKMATGLKLVGSGITGLGFAAAGCQLFNSDPSGGDYARFTGSIIITSTTAIPFVGLIISMSLGATDAYGAFEGIYNSFDR